MRQCRNSDLNRPVPPDYPDRYRRLSKTEPWNRWQVDMADLHTNRSADSGHLPQVPRCRKRLSHRSADVSEAESLCFSLRTLYLRIKLENVYFLDSKTTVSTWHEEMILLTHTSYLFVQCRIETYPPFCALELSPMQEHFDKLEFVRIQNRIYCQGLTVSIHPCSFQYL